MKFVLIGTQYISGSKFSKISFMIWQRAKGIEHEAIWFNKSTTPDYTKVESVK
jgi:hypothetical protein